MSARRVLLAALLTVGIGLASAGQAGATLTASAPATAPVRAAVSSGAEDVAKCLTMGPVAAKNCLAALGSAADKVGGSEALEGTPVGKLADAVDALDKAARSLSQFTPQNMLEEVAKKTAQWAVATTGLIQEKSIEVAKPDLNDQGWLSMYSKMAGLGFLVFAFTLLLVGARFARATNGSPDHLAIMRDAGIAPWLIPLGIVAGPAVLILFSDMATELGGVFVDQTKRSGATDVLTGMAEKLVTSSQTDFTGLGGVVGALLLFLAVGVFGLLVLLELYIAAWGIQILALLIPLAMAMYAYPPWRSVTRRLLTGIGGLLLIAPVMNFVFWTIWSTAGATDGKPMTVAFRLLVGMILLLSTPALAMWLIPKLMPDGSGASVPRASARGGGTVQHMMINRLLSKQQRAAGGQGRGARQVAPAPTNARPPAMGQAGAPAGGQAAKSGGARALTGGTAKGGASGAGSTAGGATSAAAGVGGKKAATGAATKGAGASAGAGGGAGAALGPAGVALAATAMGARAIKNKTDAARQNVTGQADNFGGSGRRSSDDG